MYVWMMKLKNEDCITQMCIIAEETEKMWSKHFMGVCLKFSNSLGKKTYKTHPNAYIHLQHVITNSISNFENVNKGGTILFHQGKWKVRPRTTWDRYHNTIEQIHGTNMPAAAKESVGLFFLVHVRSALFFQEVLGIPWSLDHPRTWQALGLLALPSTYVYECFSNLRWFQRTN